MTRTKIKRDTPKKEKSKQGKHGVYGGLSSASKKSPKSSATKKSPKSPKTPKSDKKSKRGNGPSSASSIRKSKMESAAKKTSDNKNASKKKIKVAAKVNHDRKSSKHHLTGGASSKKGFKKSHMSINERVAMSQKSTVKKSNAARAPRFGIFQTGATNGRNSQPRKRGKRKAKKIIQFQMSFRDDDQNSYLFNRGVPWHKAEESEQFRDNFTPFDTEDNRRDGSDDDSSEEGDYEDVQDGDDTTFQLPSRQILSYIDAEIQSFCAYVKLTPSERNARTLFLEHITETAMSQFGDYRQQRQGKHIYFGGGKADNGGGDENTDKIRVAPFGSFATQEVCTFASDVDMCLWGVVKGETKPELEFIDSANGSDSDANAGVDYLQHDDLPLLTESSLLRTMDAIQTAAKEQLPKAKASRPVIVDISEEPPDAETLKPKSQSKINVGKKKKSSSNSENCLFFIDRAGEDAEDADGVAEATETTDGADVISKQINETDQKIAAIREDKTIDDIEKTGSAKDVTQSGESATPTNKSKNAGEFQFKFEIDVKGVREFGGEVEDLMDLSNKGGDAKKKDLDLNAKSSPDIDNPVEKVEETKSDIADAHSSQNKIEEDSNECRPSKNKKNTIMKATMKTSEAGFSDPQFEELEPGTFSALGTSAEDAIDINDESSSDESEFDIDVDDHDSADPMSSYYSRNNASTKSTKIGQVGNTRALSINLLEEDSSTDSKEELNGINNFSDDNSVEVVSSEVPQSKKSVMELSLTPNSRINGNGAAASSTPLVKPSFGPTGKIRNKVVSVLLNLTNQLRRSSFTHTIECRSRAKVPIINCSTRTGFEGDIAIGGHNGVDTSHYAFSQVTRFNSFAPIVLLLKVIMFQQGLDKPFTGGLGSYKLYVLVAYHIEQHIANGGTDRPSEILISLLFRYGCVGECDKATTDLESLKIREDLIASDGGICDLSNAFRIIDCVGMFRECYERLSDRIDLFNDSNYYGKISHLSSIVDCFRLKDARDASVRRSTLCDNINRPTARDDPGKVTPGRKIGQIFSKHGLHQPGSETKRYTGTNGNSSSKRSRVADDSKVSPTDTSSFKRGQRGSIIPSKRPDLDAKKSLRSNPEEELMLRASKNRKNKKKQTRDSAIRSFASRKSI